MVGRLDCLGCISWQMGWVRDEWQLRRLEINFKSLSTYGAGLRRGAAIFFTA